MSTFEPFQKIARLNREATVTEKIDGTNAQVFITEDGDVIAGSRTRVITPTADNFGFAAWVEGHKSELLALGPGRHFGEWWGHGIQRGYGFKNNERFFSLFNTERWSTNRPDCCSVVPILAQGLFTTAMIDDAVNMLRTNGSVAAPGFMRPEGVVVWHDAARQLFKVTLEKDEAPKSLAA